MMRYCNEPRLTACVVPLALGQMSVDVDMDVPDGVELVVLDVVEVIVLVGVGVVVLDGVGMLVEELLFDQHKEPVYRIFHFLCLETLRVKLFITYLDFLLANQPPIPPPTPPPTMRITITHTSQKLVARRPHILLVPDLPSLAV
ncbi:hypothetical protein ZTR_05276 [Talaromyces verruculosus]|nr:hypothetical protein ZTR_05276 [Talaromyces verruculosus]